MKFNLKKLLKKIKLNEENISMVLGAVVLIIVGILIANYFKDKNSDNAISDSTQTSGVSEHTVIQGETLWSIAEDSYGSGYNWMDIKTANELESDNIEVGQKLIIPEDIEPKEPTTTISEVSTETTDSIIDETYTVVKGDTLWDIAVRAYGDGYKWVEIAETNELANPNIIHAGNVLVLPR